MKDRERVENIVEMHFNTMRPADKFVRIYIELYDPDLCMLLLRLNKERHKLGFSDSAAL